MRWGALRPAPAGTIRAGPDADKPGERVYFPELDGLRFVAFALVYLFHGGVPGWAGWINGPIRGLRDRFPGLRGWLPTNPGATIQDNGWVGVQLFFILSGYLIATLLLREEARYGRISLGAFWARRILRIWPLYYLTVLITFVALPWFDGWTWPTWRASFGRHLPWFLAFLGNWSMGLAGGAPSDPVSVLWSVCVEEQFYLVCPLLLVLVGPRWRPAAVVALMAAAVLGRYRMARAGVNPLLFQYSSLTHLDSLLGGVLLALVFARFPPGARAARALRLFQWPLWGAALWLLSRPGLGHGPVSRRTWDFVGLWLVGVGTVAVARAGRGGFAAALANPRLVWLGKISYGLYMYHEVALWLGRRAEHWLPWFPNKEPLLAIATFAATVGLAAASYYLYERPFLKLKRVWTRVPSRPV